MSPRPGRYRDGGPDEGSQRGTITIRRIQGVRLRGLLVTEREKPLGGLLGNLAVLRGLTVRGLVATLAHKRAPFL